MKKKVLFKFLPISVDVETTEGMKEKDILALAKQNLINQIQVDFPTGFTWSLVDSSQLTFEEVKMGQIVVD